MNVSLPLLRYPHEERGDSRVALAYSVRTEDVHAPGYTRPVPRAAQRAPRYTSLTMAALDLDSVLPRYVEGTGAG